MLACADPSVPPVLYLSTSSCFTRFCLIQEVVNNTIIRNKIDDRSSTIEEDLHRQADHTGLSLATGDLSYIGSVMKQMIQSHLRLVWTPLGFPRFNSPEILLAFSLVIRPLPFSS